MIDQRYSLSVGPQAIRYLEERQVQDKVTIRVC